MFRCTNSRHLPWPSSGAASSASLSGRAAAAHDHALPAVRKRNLPLPPLLDDSVIAKRKKWRGPKPTQDKSQLTPFQKRLAANPYARALADSSIRLCHYTNTRLPTFFLLDIRAGKHPSTGQSWAIPTVQPPSGKAQLGERRSVHSRMLSRRALVAIPTARTRRNTVLVSKRGLVDSLVWRDGLEDVAAKMFRESAAKRLRPLFDRAGRGLIVPLEEAGGAEAEGSDGASGVSALLFTRSFTSPALREAISQYKMLEVQLQRIVGYLEKVVDKKTLQALYPGQDVRELTNEVIPHNTYDFQSHRVPQMQPRLRFPRLRYPTGLLDDRRVGLFSLADMFGEEETRELLRGTDFENTSCMAIKATEHTLKAQLALMRLQGFLAEPLA
ncbi:hypothetical protein BDY21DRAFT_364379 [Lineolata rhizophorae]|uniref:Uncharacterized protein n=1 Tax=Lineolata rhizophorae TaxID=578093 RepID=A0A6A6NYL4_9PEZI|nr:hypothetical protein BDY21DRAFT_364379 [Lineolata rhizophorae]